MSNLYGVNVVIMLYLTDSMSDTDREVLYPFLYPVRKSKKTLKITVNEGLLKTVVEYFCPLGAVSHAQWITHLACGLLECSSLAYLQPVCISKVSTKAKIFVWLQMQCQYGHSLPLCLLSVISTIALLSVRLEPDNIIKLIGSMNIDIPK